MRFYKIFKTSFNRQKYLELIPDFQLRRCITKFRCSDHRLEIELGRHNNIKINEHICKICNAETETEEHFLRFCPTYDVIRFRYFGNLPTLQWKKVLKCEEEETAFKLAN